MAESNQWPVENGVERGLLPESVRNSDGATEPFEPERITRTLFAATLRIGSPDPFLARELTESVLHFLSIDREGTTTTGQEIAEIAEKIVRELGHPALARAYRERSVPGRPVREPQHKKSWPNWLQTQKPASRIRQEAASETLSAFSLAEVYPADLVSAHREGLLSIGGLASPMELAGICAHLPFDGLQESLRENCNLASQFIAVDGPEYELAALPGEPDEIANKYLQSLGFAAESLDVQVIINLNIGSPPAHMAEGVGPLFESKVHDATGRRGMMARALAFHDSLANIRIRWHVSELSESAPRPGVPVVLDRPRSPIHLGSGLDRQTPATLVCVGVNLTRLAEMLGGPPVSSELFFMKLASLTRFAKTAGHAKQDFLRKHGRPELREAFLLDRARLVLIPDGLEEVATMTELPPAEFVREIPRAMKLAAEQDRPRMLPVRIELSE